MLSRYIRLVVGYFLYAAARETSLNIHDLLIYLNEAEDEDTPPSFNLLMRNGRYEWNGKRELLRKM